MSFLGLEGLHVFVTGAAGGIGSAIVKEFLGMSTSGLFHYEHYLHNFSKAMGMSFEYSNISAMYYHRPEAKFG
jgi:FlaA1/EpsC-like NDP-sugar epimerase